MAILFHKKLSLMFLISLLILVSSSWASTHDHHEPIAAASFNRTSFPADFIFGTASSSYQYEGAPEEGGRGPSIWDTFTHKYPDRIRDDSNGDVANDFYHRYKEDVARMKELGMDAFRLSISWSRVLPRGKLSEGVNKKGINFYNNLINELLSKGLQPYVTIFHWDLPQALEDEYGGFLSSNIIDDFRDFAELCFKEFGDRVKHWITLNEPWSYSNGGYNKGNHAPGRCSKWINEACRDGNSAIEPYLVTHHLLLSHAAAVKVYKDKYQASQKGKIGITLATEWMVPYSDQEVDKKAARRALDFKLGWYMDPLTYGNYPNNMRTLVGGRLPKFTPQQSMLLKGSFDFIGLNYYTANYAADVPLPVSNNVNVSYSTDSLANLTTHRDGIPIGPTTGSSWLHVYPSGIRSLLLYVKRKYNNPLIYITENGVSEVNNSTLTRQEALNDSQRIRYYNSHLFFLRLAIKEGVNVKGYFVWSLLDNYEWYAGYTVRFGLVYVDYDHGLKRYRKHSAIWFKKFLHRPALLLSEVVNSDSIITL